MNSQARKYIELLGLEKHPEGGYFREIYRSPEMIEINVLPGRYTGNRNYATSIYFLLEGKNVSKFHKLKSDEIWHFYDGDPVIVYILDDKQKLCEFCLGKNIDDGEVPQLVITNGSAFGAALKNENSFCLIGCTVSPGFDFEDFELCNRDELLSQYPDNKEIIEKLT